VPVDENKELAERWRLESMEQKSNAVCIDRTHECSHERCAYGTTQHAAVYDEGYKKLTLVLALLLLLSITLITGMIFAEVTVNLQMSQRE
jgi:hypothetical protein